MLRLDNGRSEIRLQSRERCSARGKRKYRSIQRDPASSITLQVDIFCSRRDSFIDVATRIGGVFNEQTRLQMRWPAGCGYDNGIRAPGYIKLPGGFKELEELFH